MALDIRMLNTSDYEDILVGWWKSWRWTPPAKDFLPGDGTGGFIVYDDETPVCAGFLYITNSKVAWVDWVISNFNYKDKDVRREALILLIDTLGTTANMEEYKYTYALIKSPALMELYEQLGYVKGDSYTTEMIKKWQ
jgi:hypothetical protein